MLKINNLYAEVDGVEILKGLTLEAAPGQVHAIMGPNGSGKSTLARVLAGHSDYHVTSGSVTYNGQDLLALEPEVRGGVLAHGECRLEQLPRPYRGGHRMYASTRGGRLM